MLIESHIRVDSELYESCRMLDMLTSQTAVFLFQCKSDQFSDHNTGRKRANFGVKERKTNFSQTLEISIFTTVVRDCCDCKKPTGSVGVSGSNPLCSTQDLQKCKSFFVVSWKIRKSLPVKHAKWGTPSATYRNSYRNWYRKTRENQRKASIFANSFCLVSMLEWA